MLADKSVDDIIKIIGHDGSEIVDPKIPEPGCRRGFCDIEIVCAAEQLGIYLVPFFPKLTVPACIAGEGSRTIVNKTFERILEYYAGILCGNPLHSTGPHATVWDTERSIVVDPKGYEYSIERYRVEVFWASVKVNPKYSGRE